MTEEEKSRGSEGDSTNHGLPHWSEPATGQFPKVEINKYKFVGCSIKN